MKTCEVLLVTGRRRKPALLSVDDAAGVEAWVLTVDGIAQAPQDLHKGAYLVVSDPAVADEAVLAGYATEPPRTATRTRHRILGRVWGSVLLVGAVVAIFGTVDRLVALDVLGALTWLGLSVFCGLLGLVWWFAGEQIGLAEDAEGRQYSRAARSALKRLFGSGDRKR